MVAVNFAGGGTFPEVPFPVCFFELAEVAMPSESVRYLVKAFTATALLGLIPAMAIVATLVPPPLAHAAADQRSGRGLVKQQYGPLPTLDHIPASAPTAVLAAPEPEPEPGYNQVLPTGTPIEQEWEVETDCARRRAKPPRRAPPKDVPPPL